MASKRTIQPKRRPKPDQPRQRPADPFVVEVRNDIGFMVRDQKLVAANARKVRVYSMRNPHDDAWQQHGG